MAPPSYVPGFDTSSPQNSSTMASSSQAYFEAAMRGEVDLSYLGRLDDLYEAPQAQHPGAEFDAAFEEYQIPEEQVPSAAPQVQGSNFENPDLVQPQQGGLIPEAMFRETFAKWEKESLIEHEVLEPTSMQQVQGYEFDNPDLLQQQAPNNNFRAPANMAPAYVYPTPQNSGAFRPVFPVPGAAMLPTGAFLAPPAFAPGAPNPQVPSPRASPPAARGVASGRVQKMKKAKASSRPAAPVAAPPPAQFTWDGMQLQTPGKAFVPTPYQSKNFSKVERALMSQKD